MGPFIEGYRAWLAGRGYSPGTVINMLAMAGDLGRWMDARDIAAGDLDRAVIAEFRDAMRTAGNAVCPRCAWAGSAVGVLGTEGVVAVSAVLAGRSRSWWGVTGGGLSAIVGWPRPRSSVM